MIKIVVDSGCDLTSDMKSQKNIHIEVVPLTLQVDEQQFIDDEHLDVNHYLDEMEKSAHVPKTAAPSPERYIEKYKGEESVFAVTLSSKLSGSYNSAMVAREISIEGSEGKFVHVFDSLSASIGETLIALKIKEHADLNLSDLAIVDSINDFISKMKTYFVLEKFDTIVKTGRMKPYVAKLASLLSVKPICGASDGNMALIGKARGYNKAVAKLISIMQEEGYDFENKILGISHVQCLDKAVAFKDEVMKKIKFKDVIILEASGLCSTYANRGGLIIAF